MSILIKGAKMPKSCAECDFIEYDDEYEYECWCPIIRSNVEEYTENKPASCPLVEIPSADVVEVVRCKDCKQWDEENHSCNIRDSYGWDYKPTDYCSYGEKKDGSDTVDND